jgi:hypothetical protein
VSVSVVFMPMAVSIGKTLIAFREPGDSVSQQYVDVFVAL